MMDGEYRPYCTIALYRLLHVGTVSCFFGIIVALVYLLPAGWSQRLSLLLVTLNGPWSVRIHQRYTSSEVFRTKFQISKFSVMGSRRESIAIFDPSEQPANFWPTCRMHTSLVPYLSELNRNRQGNRMYLSNRKETPKNPHPLLRSTTGIEVEPSYCTVPLQYPSSPCLLRIDPSLMSKKRNPSIRIKSHTIIVVIMIIFLEIPPNRRSLMDGLKCFSVSLTLHVELLVSLDYPAAGLIETF